MRSWIYLEYLEPIFDYFDSVGKQEAFHDWLLPLGLSLLTYFFLLDNLDFHSLRTIAGHLVSVLAILIGFSITCLTILIAGGGERIRELQSSKSKKTIRGKNASVFQILLVNLSFLLFLEFFCLSYSFVFILFEGVKCFSTYSQEIYTLGIFLAIQVFLINIRNITNLYFVFYKPTKS